MIVFTLIVMLKHIDGVFACILIWNDVYKMDNCIHALVTEIMVLISISNQNFLTPWVLPKFVSKKMTKVCLITGMPPHSVVITTILDNQMEGEKQISLIYLMENNYLIYLSACPLLNNFAIKMNKIHNSI